MAEVKINEDRPVTAAQVRVTNRNDFDLEDMFDGVPYVFPGRTYEKGDTERKNPQYHPVTVPPDVAAHIFAYGRYADMPPKQQLNAMFDHIAKRFGWNAVHLADGKGREFFRNIDIRPVLFRLVEETADEGEARGQRGKTA